MLERRLMNNISILVVEKIFHWERLDRPELLYRKPDTSNGFAEHCPNFLGSELSQTMLREEMSRRGYSLSITHKPANFETNEGRTSTAIFSGEGREFESTQPDENAAVCIAALLTVGISAEFIAG